MIVNILTRKKEIVFLYISPLFLFKKNPYNIIIFPIESPSLGVDNFYESMEFYIYSLDNSCKTV